MTNPLTTPQNQVGRNQINAGLHSAGSNIVRANLRSLNPNDNKQSGRDQAF